jgi:hypothetical protein
MKWKTLFFSVLIIFVVLNCSQYRELSQEESNRVRQIKPKEISSYHEPLKLEIAWLPYEEHRLVRTKKNEWKMVKNEDVRVKSNMPMILLTYPNSTDTIWFDMNVDNAMLGKLMKHSLMTQVPISRPFTEYVEVAKCGTCHPSHIDKGFETE